MTNILVCDDDKEIVDAIEIYLQQEGYQIYKAYDGEQAIKVLKETNIQLLIIDIMMPRLDGIHATLKIREFSSVPIIFLSAKSEDTDKILGLNMGADDYITKPFNPLELVARVKSNLRRYTQLGSLNVENNALYQVGGLCMNDDTKEVKLVSVYRDSFLAVDDKDSLRKLNAAYAKGGPTGAVAALNKNLDLNITEYVSVDFNAVMEVVDALGGIELDITKEEASNMHIWIDEMNEVMGTHGKPVSGPGVQQVNGIQALAYCRDRMSGGDDFRRTERQRIVVGKIVEKAKQADILTLNDLVDKLFPDISTSLSTTEILGLAAHVKEYELADTQGWPFQLDTKMMEKSIGAVVVPTDLETNVDLLHRYLFDVEDYETTDEVKEISKAVSNRTGKTAADTTRDTNPLVQDAAAAEITE